MKSKAAIQSAKWRRENPGRVKKDNKRRKDRLDRRKINRWKKLRSWIYSRCHCSRGSSYSGYGGRGIECRITWLEIAKVWFRDYAWMMQFPQLDRMDPTGHYELRNVRFIERDENLARRVFNNTEREPGEEG